MDYQEELDIERKPSKKKSRNKQKKASTGKEYTIIAYCFVGIFLALIGYLVYFNVELRDEYANSPYNSKRQGTYQERVTKGKILASDGDILASTEKMRMEMNFGCIRMKMYLLMLWDTRIRVPVVWNR